jgi:hypothetical protein
MPEIAEPLRQHQGLVAYHLWWRRQRPAEDDQRDWFEAERILTQEWVAKRLLWLDPEALVWEKWAREQFAGRTYLAIEAVADPAGVVKALTGLAERARVAQQCAVLAALDGSPEYSRECFRTAAGAARAEAKDATFYRLCHPTLALHGGAVLGPPPGSGEAVGLPRHYQDGCAAAFATAPKALAAALHLHRALAACNEAEDRPVYERLYARVAIGPSWAAAVRCLPLAWRGEVVVAPECLEQLGGCPEAKSLGLELLFAAGVRVGPRA